MAMRRVALGAALLGLATSAAAMPVSEFLPRAERLKARGAAALFSSDLKPIMAEVKRVGRAYRADIERDRAAGRTPRSCPPPKGTKMNPDDLMVYLRSIPARQRGIDMTEAFHRFMAARFPC